MAMRQLELDPPSPSEPKQLPTPPSEPNTSVTETSKTTMGQISSAPEELAKSASTQTEIQEDTESSSTSEIKKTKSASDDKDDKSKQSDKAKADSEETTKTEAIKDGDSKEFDDKDKADDKKADEDKEKDKKKALPRGMKDATKLLWAKTDAQCKCCTTWVESDPDDGKNVEESDECLQHAIVVRKKKKHEGNRKPLKVDSIVVHSPLIKRVLQKVFSGYPDMVVDLDELIFDAPFAPFFHRWEALKKVVKDEKDEMTKSHLKLLYDALDKELEKPIQRHKDLVRSKAIDFELLWTLYTPGALMYSHDDNHDRLYKTTDCEYWQDLSGMKFTVRCDMIDWDGEKFGKVCLSETMSKFKGTRQITSLPSYPLKFHLKADEIYEKCVARGRRFQELAGVHCKDYKGTAIEFIKYSVQTVQSKRQLEGRIMLDEELFLKSNPDEDQNLRELGDDDEDEKSEVEAAQRLEEQAQKAIEALKKAKEEEKAKEAKEAEKAKEEAEKKAESDTKSEEKADKEDSSKQIDSDKKAEVEEPALKDKEESVESSTKLDTKSISERTKEAEVVGTDSTSEGETSGKAEQATEDQKQDPDSSASTDSDWVTTPASESEETSEQAKPYSQTEKQELNEEQLALCTSWLRGYSLTYQKWASFSVEHISDVSWNDNAFSELTLPPDYRELILATIKSQIRQNQWKQKMEKAEKEQKPITAMTGEDEDEGAPEFDDFIAQKGLGYIMLFSGKPGVGKTATAESIAELLHVPLCAISVGNLGTNAESVESGLQDILELASKWNAVLLLDEADIFLEQRTRHDLHRNAVVSVFLRLLEYYQGVLCLTTNRSEEIDEAFHSRIHISLPFPDLTESSREQIWRHFAKITNNKHELSAAKRKAVAEKKAQTTTMQAQNQAHKSEPPVSEENVTTNGTKTVEPPKSNTEQDSLIELQDSDFRKLSQTPLNGRQIKNAFKTAVLLASYKKEKVHMKHVKTALKTIDGNGLGKREVGRMYY